MLNIVELQMTANMGETFDLRMPKMRADQGLNLRNCLLYHFLLREHEGNELKNYPEQQDRKLVSN